jgi:hypothetical protein
MWTDMQTLPDDQQEVVICMIEPHHGTTVLASRYLSEPHEGPFWSRPAGFLWGGGVIAADQVLCWMPIPQDPRLTVK